MSLVVKMGKMAKKTLRRVLPPPAPTLGYARRIQRVSTPKRMVAMTFDDGPMALPPSPDQFQGQALTDVILDILAAHNAKGTFDVIGDTSENYPDKAGALGSPAWGGVRFDHYPDINEDRHGGAKNNDRLIRRILEEGHQITNHGYRHIIFGKKPFVYGKRVYLGSFDKAVADLERLHRLMEERYGYQLGMARPAHYVDGIGGGFTSYDVCERLGYQYLGASFDGAGWLPSTARDPAQALEEEIEAMMAPLRQALEQDPDALCGQIIFQKDGYNMAKRTPVAWGLERQLWLLESYGYQVVTVDRLLAESPFADLGRGDPLFERMLQLAQERAVAYSDNCLRLNQRMTWGELAMLITPKEEALERRWAKIRETGKGRHRYAGALEYCREQEFFPAHVNPGKPVDQLPAKFFEPTMEELTRREVYSAFRGL